ncbi:hypothetical protein PRZ48_005689 [Zasmidium cellare]|uniref:Uncharacterized protein n=1 Tax=Zasmidium cellare TaxID=395010 RepID=A0ABR0EL02_ZASCE|nr:hypothetical protein PRZ48_005689 [Zasmidium cellare]
MGLGEAVDSDVPVVLDLEYNCFSAFYAKVSSSPSCASTHHDINPPGAKSNLDCIVLLAPSPHRDAEALIHFPTFPQLRSPTSLSTTSPFWQRLLPVENMDTDQIEVNVNDVVEYVRKLQDEQPNPNDNEHLPMESPARQELRGEVAPLLEKVHKEYCALFCKAYEEHDHAKAVKLKKLLEQMLVSLRSST